MSPNEPLYTTLYVYYVNILRRSEDRILRMTDLEESVEEEIGKASTRTNFRRQDSAAESMYN